MPTKLAGDHVRVLIDGYELTGDSNWVHISDTYDMHDVTAFGHAAHNFLPGQYKSVLEHSGYLNPLAGGSHPALKDQAIDNGAISVYLGQNAAPVVGDPVYTLRALQGKYQSQVEPGKIVPFAAAFASSGSHGGMWGVALAVGTTFTNTANGTTVDNGAATTKGAVAALHILQAAATDTYVITLEGSTTGAFAGEQTTLTTFSLNASTLGGDRRHISGTIPRYTRWRAVRTGSANNTVRIAVNLARL
jgi:hypothetical protein